MRRETIPSQPIVSEEMFQCTGIMMDYSVRNSVHCLHATLSETLQSNKAPHDHSSFALSLSLFAHDGELSMFASESQTLTTFTSHNHTTPPILKSEIPRTGVAATITAKPLIIPSSQIFYPPHPGYVCPISLIH